MGQISSRGRPAEDAAIDDGVRTLVQMGFERAMAREALSASAGDVNAAAELLLSSARERASREVPAHPSEADMRRQRALLAAQSRAAASRAPSGAATTRPSGGAARSGSSAAPRGGMAAAMPTARRAPSREERIVSAARQLSTMPASLDLLITSLTRVLAHPGDPKYQRVPANNPNFKQHVVNAPGGMELLYAVGYEKEGDALVLRTHDGSVLSLALSALEAQRSSSHYVEAKEEAILSEALQASKAEWNEAEKARRAAAAARVPKEPEDGAAGNTLLCFHLGNSRDKSRCIWRRFESWNTLEDVCAFVESMTPFRVGETAHLYDITLATPTRLDERADLGRTLQVLNLWPSGHLRVTPIGAF